MKTEELKIPVPWGHIAVKAWGNEKDPVILVVHGWTDNAGSFDRLIPLLPSCYYYYCIDLPGHGRSSHLDCSLLFFQPEYLVVLKFVHDYLQRGKIALLGHSIGGYLATHFAQIYPECVSRLMVIDVIHYYPKSPVAFNNQFKLTLNARLRMLMRQKRTGATVTKEEAIRRVRQARMTPISRDVAEILVERNLEETADGRYRFTVADAVKLMVHTEFTIREIGEMVRCVPVKCPHLIVMSEASSMTRFAYKTVLQEYRKNRHFALHIVKGNHECHLTYPEEVAPLIAHFLSSHHSKL